MGGKSSQTVGYRYYMGLHMSLCQAADTLLAIVAGGAQAWAGSVAANTRIALNKPNLWGGDDKEGGLVGGLDVMFGLPDQPANDYLVNRLEPGDLHPAYRGTFGLVYRQGQVSANNPYLKPWAFQLRRVTTGWDGPTWYPAKAAIDVDNGIVGMNPAHIVYECITNRDWGMGWPQAVLDLASFTAAADQLYAEKFGLCLKWNQQELVENFLGIVMNHIGGVFIPDRHTGKRKLRLIRGGYDLASLPVFDASNVLSLESFERASLDGAVNEVVVTWHDQVTDTDRPAPAQNLAGISAAGRVVSQSNDYAGIANADLAARIAKRDLNVISTPLAKVKLKVNRSAYDLLPGDVRRFTWPELGIVDMPLRIGDVDFGAYDAAAITIDAVEDAFGLPAETYVGPSTGAWVEPDRSPQSPPFRRVLESTYRDLARRLSAADLAALDPASGYLATLGTRPSGAAYNYSVFSRLGTAAFADNGTGDFTPTATLAAAIGASDTAITIAGGVDLDLVTLGSAALIDDEIVRVDALSELAGTATLARGCADTLPATHAAGARVYFYGVHNGYDRTEYLVGEKPDVKLLTNTGQGQLAAASAPTDSVTMAQRQARPYPPAGVKINGSAAPATVTAPIAVTFARRNRVTQADQLVDASVGDIAPEAGQTTTVQILTSSTAVANQQDGLTGTANTPWSPTAAGTFSVKVWSVRDGLPSRVVWQSAPFAVTLP